MKLGIGTVQFGIDYGISNSQGRTPAPEVATLLQLALEHQITVIDTAPSYGESETVIGQSLPQSDRFKIVTKTPVFNPKVESDQALQELQDCFQQSLKRLGRTSVYGLLVHHASDLIQDSGAMLMARLQELKQQGLVQKIGVSVYTGEQIDLILAKFNLDLIQLPLNILDQRLLHSGHLRRLKKIGCEIHARSVFLQGLLLLAPETLPSFFDPVKPLLCKYHQAVQSLGCSPQKAALDFVNSLAEVDHLIVGLNSAAQLQELIVALQQPATRLDFSSYAFQEENILNPAQWQL